MVAVDLGPWGQVQGCQDFMRCVKYEETVGEVHNVLYILHYYWCYHYYYKQHMESSSRCNGSFWQVWEVLLGSCVLHLPRWPERMPQPLVSRSRHHSTVCGDAHKAHCLVLTPQCRAAAGAGPSLFCCCCRCFCSWLPS